MNWSGTAERRGWPTTATCEPCSGRKAAVSNPHKTALDSASRPESSTGHREIAYAYTSFQPSSNFEIHHWTKTQTFKKLNSGIHPIVRWMLALRCTGQKGGKRFSQWDSTAQLHALFKCALNRESPQSVHTHPLPATSTSLRPELPATSACPCHRVCPR